MSMRIPPLSGYPPIAPTRPVPFLLPESPRQRTPASHPPPIFGSIEPHRYAFPFLDITLSITPNEQPADGILLFYQSVIETLHITLTHSIQGNQSKLIQSIDRLCNQNPPPTWAPILNHTVIPMILTKLNGDSIQPFFFKVEIDQISARLNKILSQLPPHHLPANPTNHHQVGCEYGEFPEREGECTPAPLQSVLIMP